MVLMIIFDRSLINSSYIFLQSVLGTVLCLGQKNGGIIPLNKNLW